MKFILLMGMLVLNQLCLFSQSVQDVANDIYHEKYKSAEDKAQAILTGNPNDGDAWYSLTQIYLAKDSVAKAKQKLLSAPAEVLSTPLLKAALGHIHLREGNKAEAKANFDYALKKTREKKPAVLHAVAKAQMDAKAGDPAYGLALINKALKRDKKNPALYVTMGDLYRKLGNGSESYRAYQNALEKDKNYVAAIYKIGKIFTSQDNKDMYLKYFKQAVSIDSLYAPALYDLYYYYYFRDVNVAQDYLRKYIASTDKSIEHDYMITDLMFASQQYDSALQNANKLMNMAGTNVEPRLLKLIAYSYKELKKPDSALAYMHRYFDVQTDTGFIVKDYEGMAEIYDSLPGMDDSASTYYQRALAMESDSVKALDYYKKIADLYHESGDFQKEALWLGKYHRNNPSPRNIDLFNWGIASYKASDYIAADSIFKMYQQGYPDQTFGYYWAARTNTAIDSTMEKGLAIPHYQKLIEIAEKDTADDTNKKHLIEAYGYLAAYEANIDKDFDDSILYFEKLLELDPGNEDAKKYLDILRKSLANQEASDKGK
ncbi:tetratricopeptide repeat protein [Flavitalea antarctica]